MDDPLSALPDHVLSTIIRKLDLKEAVRTSTLSKRWRYIWTHYRELKFNHVNILGLKSRLEKNEWAGLDTNFVKWVDKIMEQRFVGEIRKVNSFYIQFPLGASFSSSINRWINFVVASSVETIDLDLWSPLPIEKHNFSLLKAISKNEIGTLKHLRITHCNFQARTVSSPKFGSLISIQLESVNIRNFQLAKVLESCPLLEKLTLDTCLNLTKLAISATLLKHLSLINCLYLKEIDVIRAQNLTSLKLEEVMINNLQLERFIKRCPLLEEFSLDRCSNLTILRIGDTENNNCTLLKHLTLINCLQLKEIDLIRAQNLTFLDLEDVMINSLQLQMFIKRCPLLEGLSLERCSNLTKLIIGDLENHNCSVMKHLSLINCLNLREIDVICAKNLISLELEDVMINSLQLEMFIKHCPLLEELCLNRCPNVKYLRILESNHSLLKFLYMMNCWELLDLQLCANLLHTLECTVMTDWFPVMKTPKLVNVFIGEAVDLQHPITRIVHDIPSIKNLILGSYHTLKFLLSNDVHIPVLSLRRLVLSVNLCDDRDELFWVNYILQAFPFLETLELNFRSLPPLELDYKKTMAFNKCPNGAITKLEINGFDGNQRVVNVLMYLLENLTGLRELAISPSCKRHRSFICWSKEEARANWFHCNYERLRTIVPLNVDLKYMEDLDSNSDLL